MNDTTETEFTLDADAEAMLAAFRSEEQIPEAVDERVWASVEAATDEDRTVVPGPWGRRAAVGLIAAAAAVALVWVSAEALQQGSGNGPVQAAHEARVERAHGQASPSAGGTVDKRATHGVATPGAADSSAPQAGPRDPSLREGPTPRDPQGDGSEHADAPDGPELNGPELNGPELNGPGPDGSAPDASAPNGSAPNGSAPNGSAPNGSAPGASAPDTSRRGRDSDRGRRSRDAAAPKRPHRTKPAPAPDTTHDAPTEPTQADAPEPSTLGQEIALIERARKALLRHAPADAIKALREHASTFPKGAMAQERRALLAIATCESQGRDAGQTRASSFLRDHPSSSLAERVRSACGVE